MLQELRVQSFAIIERQSVRFGPGLNVLTGETGAGKSLLVDALALAVGGRASAEAVRAGAKEAVVEALFAPEDGAGRAALDAALTQRGLPTADGALLVKRVVSAAGRHRVYLNGGLATVSLLAEVAAEAVDIVGQHEHMALLRPGVHLAVLDAFAGHEELLEAWHRAWATLEEARGDLVRLDGDAAQRAEREAFLRFRLQEIERVAPVPGEVEALEAERGRLAHAEKLREAAGYGEQALYAADGAVVEVLGRVVARLREAARLDGQLAPLLEGLDQALAVVEDHGRELAAYVRGLEADPARLDTVENRLSDLRRLARGHGGDLEAVVAAAEDLRAELETLTGHDDLMEAARARVRAAEAEAEGAAKALRRSRQRAGKALAAEVEALLGDLGMAATRFEVACEPLPRLSPHGGDRVELRIAPGPEEPARSLAKVASGGELSRILLALRRVLAARDPVPTVVFDEVDAGIGGGAAEVVGRLLQDVAADRQVLCVTHLPQVAAHADHHLTVSKDTGEARPRVTVQPVEGDGRRDEIARMLGGSVTERSRAHAAELLERARRGDAGGRSGQGGGAPRRGRKRAA